jgi:uncharacterized protein (TIGR02118 family)
MVKEIVFIKRKQGLSREKFYRHYEEVHTPLVVKYFPTIKRYVRNYIIAALGTEEPDFDCITEVWYDSMEGFQALSDAYGSETGKAVREDERNFMDRNKMRVFLVDERVTKRGRTVPK